MAQAIYRQCMLRRDSHEDTVFIPSALAKVGKVLSVNIGEKSDGDIIPPKSWQSGWVVVEVYEGVMTEEQANSARTARVRFDKILAKKNHRPKK